MENQLGLKAVEIAAGFIGQKEATGHNDGTFVDGLEKWIGDWRAPWCAIFMSYCVFLAAKALGIVSFHLPRSDSSTSLYSWFRKNGHLLAVPIPGCVGLVKGDGGSPGKTHHHTFLVESVDLDKGIVHSIDGNSDNKVQRTVHRIVDCNFGQIV